MWWWNEEVKSTLEERRWHLKSCTGSFQKKIRPNTNVTKIKQEKLLQEL